MRLRCNFFHNLKPVTCLGSNWGSKKRLVYWLNKNWGHSWTCFLNCSVFREDIVFFCLSPHICPDGTPISNSKIQVFHQNTWNALLLRRISVLLHIIFLHKYICVFQESPPTTLWVVCCQSHQIVSQLEYAWGLKFVYMLVMKGEWRM